MILILIPWGGLPTRLLQFVVAGILCRSSSCVVIDDAHSVIPYAVHILAFGTSLKSFLRYLACSSPPPSKILCTDASRQPSCVPDTSKFQIQIMQPKEFAMKLQGDRAPLSCLSNKIDQHESFSYSLIEPLHPARQMTQQKVGHNYIKRHLLKVIPNVGLVIVSEDLIMPISPLSWDLKANFCQWEFDGVYGNWYGPSW